MSSLYFGGIIFFPSEEHKISNYFQGIEWKCQTYSLRPDILSHIAVTIDGLDCIKAFQLEELMISKFISYVNYNISDKLALAYLSNWFQLQVSYLHAIINFLIFGFVVIAR